MSTIRILFWGFILIQALLLVFSEKIKGPFNAKHLDWSFWIKVAIVAAYFIWTMPKISLFTDWFLHLFGGFCVVGLLLLVWRAYLPKSLSKDKVYVLKELEPERKYNQGESCCVFGIIDENKHSFTAALLLRKDDFCELRAKGFYDEKEGKTLNVKISEDKTRSVENVDLVVELA